MSKVLFIGHQWPDQNATAAGVRILQLLRYFHENGWELHFASAAQIPSQLSQLGELNCTSHSVQMNHLSFDEFAANLDPDIVVFDRFMVEEQFGWRVAQACPRALRILDMEDFHSLRKARQEAVEKKRPFHLDDVKSETSLREVASIFRSDLSLVISEFEMNLLKELFQVPSSIIHYLPFLPKPLLEEDIVALPAFEDRIGFISIGNFLHAPNKDALFVLKDAIWPRIRERIPNAVMNAFGSHASTNDFKLKDPDNGFYVHGKADNADEVIRNSRVLLAPLRFGAGLKGKLIDTMRNGTPSVTTSIGSEGMASHSDWGGAVEDDFQHFADQAIVLHENPAYWKAAQRQGFKQLNDRFNKAEHSLKLTEKIDSILKDLYNHRRANFIGEMLRHHTMKSSEFMARWIQEKSRK